MNDIDFVILWVDGNDPNWLKEKSKYDINIKGKEKIILIQITDTEIGTIYNIGLGQLKNILLGLRKIHLITWGHLPKWLNINHPILLFFIKRTF